MKNQTKIIITILFFVVLAIDIYAVVVENKGLEMTFKPLIVTLLAVLYLMSVRKPSFWYLSALLFCFWGDILLLFQEKHFVLGLVSFLVAHLLYIKLISIHLYKVTVMSVIKFSIPFVLYFSTIIFLTVNNLKSFLVPVIVYGLVISAFGTTTLVNYVQNKNKTDLLLLLGATIFILSDSFIALNKFYISHPIYGVLIMLTYGVAQYLICRVMIIKGLEN